MIDNDLMKARKEKETLTMQLPSTLGAKPETSCVSIAFSSDFTKLELVWLNTQTGQIINAGFVPITGFDLSTRMIHNGDALSESMANLLHEMSIPIKVPVSIMLPSFYTRIINIPSGLTEADTASLIAGEAERSVLFKKEEPTIDWVVLDLLSQEDEVNCLYTAYPTTTLNELLRIVEDVLKLQICAIESNLTAVIKGLLTTGTLQNDDKIRLVSILNEGTSSNLVLQGIHILHVAETPVSLQNIKSEELVHDVQQDISGLSSLLTNCNEVIVIHNNSRVPSELLAQSFANFEEVILVEQTVETIASLGARRAFYPCTVEALGAAMSLEMANVPSLNLLPKSKQLHFLLQGLRRQVLPFAIAGNVLVFLLVLVAYGVLSVFNVTNGIKLGELEKTIAQHQAPSTSPEIYAEAVWLKRYSDFNVNVVKWLINVQKELPNTLWIDSLSLQQNKGKPFLKLTGGSQTGQDIAGYFDKIQPTFSTDKITYSDVTPTNLQISPSLSNVSKSGKEQAAPVETKTEQGSTANKPVEKVDKISGENAYYKWQAHMGADPAAPDAAPAAAAAPAATPPAATPPAA